MYFLWPPPKVLCYTGIERFFSGQLGRYFFCPAPEHRLTLPADITGAELAAQHAVMQVDNVTTGQLGQPLLELPFRADEPEYRSAHLVPPLQTCSGYARSGAQQSEDHLQLHGSSLQHEC